MKKTLFAALAAVVIASASYAASPTNTASFTDRFDAVGPVHRPNVVLAQAKDTTQITTSAPVTATTTVKGGDLAASVIDWLKIAFGTILAGIGTLVLVRIRDYFGIQTTAAQKDVFQSMAVTAVNSAADKVSSILKNNPGLDINVKDRVVAEAVLYLQGHAKDTITALGLDPKSGDAVEAMKARINRALNSLETPVVTDVAILPSPVNTQPLAPRVA